MDSTIGSLAEIVRDELGFGGGDLVINLEKDIALHSLEIGKGKLCPSFSEERCDAGLVFLALGLGNLGSECPNFCGTYLVLLRGGNGSIISMRGISIKEHPVCVSSRSLIVGVEGKFRIDGRTSRGTWRGRFALGKPVAHGLFPSC